MIGHYLLTLTPAAEDAVLTTAMRPGSYRSQLYRSKDTGPCLVGTACGSFVDTRMAYPCYLKNLADLDKGFLTRDDHWWSIESQYDDLCRRFGTERINTAIRNRILSNRLNRVLRAVPCAV